MVKHRPAMNRILELILLVATVCLMIGLFNKFVIIDASTFSKNSQLKYQRSSEGNNLDGCYHIYLDVGTNIGIQVRKLFEPRYPPPKKKSEFFFIFTSNNFFFLLITAFILVQMFCPFLTSILEKLMPILEKEMEKL